MITKDKLIYDESDLQNSDQVGANLVGSSGAKVTSTSLDGGKEALDVAIVNNIEWDEISTTFPNSNVELYTYKKNAVPVQTVLVTYENATKKTILSLVKTRL
jgi:hypothetical protein